ncbi:putative aldouronate transport system permease protein [Paenibacillus sp. UNCCL117]|uniref:carbohydrate ABC transporter permease n=1 Tax=unclassified Paenibacillus TaxID=185978 RepID=UPI00087FD1DF|nr:MULTISPECIES: carbohydrate ABC transporter permease [unclassified Paenibacillus]SDD08134.1 carbohydrate ABC transporter membrane protein 2, CUT1 family [Paenibacillus sp. cl123]SFW31291.1 putative aldouronate transport system permease protein [Paenibacillus sp. UNCCL117]
MVRGIEDKLFNTVVYTILAFVGLMAVVPFLYVISVSLTPYAEVLKNGGYVLIPKEITFQAYAKILGASTIWNALKVTVFVTVVGTAVNLLLTLLLAYPLSRKGLPHRSLFLFMVVFTLLFNGGIIPTYLVVKSTGLIDTVWALILPNAIWSFNALIMKSFFESLPEELFESARMDGAGEFRVLWQLVVPLSLPSVLTIGLFYAVGHWNQFFQAIMYITDRTLFPLQVVVREMLMLSQQTMESAENMVPTVTMQMGAVVVASLPMIIVYPFLQKHFTKGMLMGSIKG